LDMSRLNKDELPGGPFRKVSFEFVNGIRTYTNGSRLPADQIRVIKSTFSVPRSWMNCFFHDRPYGRIPANGGWTCQLKSALEIGEMGHYCKGIAGLTSPCGFLTTTSESFISLPEFKKTYS